MLLRRVAVWSLCWSVFFSQIPASFASLSTSIQFEVRTTGSDSNAGCFDPTVASPGTDFSQQDSAQVSYSDLVIGATNTQLTSAAHAFGSTSVGNCLVISGGTGFTTGLYEVISVSGSTATMDRAVGTASSTGGIGNLGGGLLTLQKAGTQNTTYGCTTHVTPTIWVKTGTYTVTSSITSLFSTTCMPSVVGYTSTHGDSGTRPLVTTATNSIKLVTPSVSGGRLTVNNVDFSNTAGTSGPAFEAAQNINFLGVSNSKLTGFNNAFDGNFNVDFNITTLYVNRIEVVNDASYAIWNNAGGTITVLNSYLHNGAAAAINVSVRDNAAVVVVKDSIIANNAGAGILGTPSFCALTVTNSTFSGNTGSDIDLSSGFATPGAPALSNCLLGSISNNIFYGNGTGAYGINVATNGWTTPTFLSFNNAYGNHATGNTLNFADPGQITLTANPFTNSSLGDYSLNSTTGGGAALKGLGYPGVIGSSTGHLDIGAIQSAGSGGGSSPTASAYSN